MTSGHDAISVKNSDILNIDQDLICACIKIPKSRFVLTFIANQKVNFDRYRKASFLFSLYLFIILLYSYWHSFVDYYNVIIIKKYQNLSIKK